MFRCSQLKPMGGVDICKKQIWCVPKPYLCCKTLLECGIGPCPSGQNRNSFFLWLGFLGMIGLTLFSGTVFAQEVQWIKFFGTENWDEASDIVAYDSSLYVVGEMNRPERTGGEEYTTTGFLRKYDLQGDLLWEPKEWEARSRVSPRVTVDASGVSVIGNAGSGNLRVLRYSHDGKRLWDRKITAVGTYPNNRSYYWGRISGHSSGVYITLKNTPAQYDDNGSKFYLIEFRKLDLSTGQDVWSPPKYIVGNQFPSYVFSHLPHGISVFDSGIFVLTESGETPMGGLLHKYHFNGEKEWSKFIGKMLPVGIAGNDTGLYILGVGLAGEISGTPPVPPNPYAQPAPLPFDDGRAFIRKYDFTGQEVWTTSVWIPQQRPDFTHDMLYPLRFLHQSITAEDNAVYITGRRGPSEVWQETDPAKKDAFVFHSRVWGGTRPKLTGWYRDLFDNNARHTAHGIVSIPGGLFVVGGVTREDTSMDAYILKLDKFLRVKFWWCQDDGSRVFGKYPWLLSLPKCQGIR